MKSTAYAFLSCVALAAIACRALPPPLTAPLAPEFYPEPKLLDAEQRRGVMLELGRLTSEIQAARREVENDPVLDDIKAQIAAAATNNVPEAALQTENLKVELNSMIYVLLNASEGVAEKQARAVVLGRMLEYDMKFFKDLRRRGKGPTANFFQTPAPAPVEIPEAAPEAETE